MLKHLYTNSKGTALSKHLHVSSLAVEQAEQGGSKLYIA